MGKPSITRVNTIRNITITILFTLVLVTPGLAGIRGAEWGMSKEQIKELEGKPKEEGEDRIIYEDLVGGLKTEVIYLFNHRNELYSITYEFLMDSKERLFMNRALNQFDRINRILHENYGPPTSGQDYSDKEKRIGMLVLKRPIIEEWKKDEATYVRHMLLANDMYKHSLTYGHPGLTDEYEQLLKRKEMDKL